MYWGRVWTYIFLQARARAAFVHVHREMRIELAPSSCWTVAEQVAAGVAACGSVRVIMHKELPAVEPKALLPSSHDLQHNFGRVYLSHGISGDSRTTTSGTLALWRLCSCRRKSVFARIGQGIYSAMYCLVALNCVASLENNPRGFRSSRLTAENFSDLKVVQQEPILRCRDWNGPDCWSVAQYSGSVKSNAASSVMHEMQLCRWATLQRGLRRDHPASLRQPGTYVMNVARRTGC